MTEKGKTDTMQKVKCVEKAKYLSPTPRREPPFGERRTGRDREDPLRAGR